MYLLGSGRNFRRWGVQPESESPSPPRTGCLVRESRCQVRDVPDRRLPRVGPSGSGLWTRDRVVFGRWVRDLTVGTD